ncbi:MAG: hypothetical protein K6E10_11465 [Eubacterium sp.]|nr:hypothetical protein [Eubacterium sp.]
MGFFSNLFSKNISGQDKELDAIVNQIKVDLSNNYKDNAVLGIKDLEKLLGEKEAGGKLKNAQPYHELLEHFKEDVASFKRTY